MVLFEVGTDKYNLFEIKNNKYLKKFRCME